MFRLLISVLALLTACATGAFSQERNTILVLDGSGSMWGQIDGKHKIEIAREVIGTVIGDIPQSTALGLVAYGHNRKGDCSDIEQLVPVGQERDTILQAVKKLNPRGKTPLSDAVVFAAEQLKYTEEAATVILVSDGIETCQADPCAVGKALEESGVDFTAHVIGFDVAEEDAIAQLQCLAENTGGEFISASNASELATALETTVAKAPEPPKAPEPGKLAMRATELENGPEIASGLNWQVAHAGGGETLYQADGLGATQTELPPGVYDVTVTRASNGDTVTAKNVQVKPGADKGVTLVLDIALSASLRAVPEDQAAANSELIVYWEGPNREGDYVTIVAADAREGQYGTYSYTAQGQPLALRVPAEVGSYEVRYMLAQPTKTLAAIPLTVVDVTAALEAPDQVNAGSTFEVTWDGPDGEGDWITIVTPDAGETQYKSYAYPRNGKTLELTASTEAGIYELRYVMAGTRVIARRPIEVKAVSASINAPETVAAGARFNVTWEGPGERGDWITIIKPDAADTAYKSYAYPANGDVLELTAETEPGIYEVRYVQAGTKVLARRPIVVEAVSATVSGPPNGVAGTNVAIDWTGPAGQSDFVTIVSPDADDTAYNGYFYPRNEDPSAVLPAPLEAGSYEIRYVQAGRKVLARAPIEVLAATATLTAPPNGIAGTEIKIEWQGPDAKNDFVTVAEPGSGDTKFMSYFYTRHGTPGGLDLPLEPGTYELRYVLRGKRVLARHMIEVTTPVATLEAPASVIAEAPFEATWSGPLAKNDLVTIAKVGAPENRYESYRYARHGSPAQFKAAPKEPGTYELRYVLRGKKVIATRPITVEAGE